MWHKCNILLSLWLVQLQRIIAGDFNFQWLFTFLNLSIISARNKVANLTLSSTFLLAGIKCVHQHMWGGEQGGSALMRAGSMSHPAPEGVSLCGIAQSSSSALLQKFCTPTVQLSKACWRLKNSDIVWVVEVCRVFYKHTLVAE